MDEHNNGGNDFVRVHESDNGESGGDFKYSGTGSDKKDGNKSFGGNFPKNPFKDIVFYFSYAAAMAVLNALPFPLMTFIVDRDWSYFIYVLCIPYAVAGLILWAFTRKKNGAVALGMLFGCQTPFYVVCLLTGGCGMYSNWINA